MEKDIFPFDWLIYWAFLPVLANDADATGVCADGADPADPAESDGGDDAVDVVDAVALHGNIVP